MTSDIELLHRWREGERAAGEELFERYHRSISRFFASKVAGDPLDLIQETFLRCLQGRDRLVDASRFRSYLFGTAYNVLREFYRDVETRGARFDPATSAAADPAPGAGTMLAEAQESALILEGLRRIPVQFQVVLELFYWEPEGPGIAFGSRGPWRHQPAHSR
jgi:RNA polymerase sigma-70 factor (ECF subfamily)